LFKGDKLKINVRQEIAMWVLGLLWTALGFAVFTHSGSESWEGLVGDIVVQLVLLVPVCLIIFSLRTRQKPDHTKHE
jgi:hypothetical protein